MSNLEVLKWDLIGVEERLGYFLKISERCELTIKREYLILEIKKEEQEEDYNANV